MNLNSVLIIGANKSLGFNLLNNLLISDKFKINIVIALTKEIITEESTQLDKLKLEYNNLHIVHLEDQFKISIKNILNDNGFNLIINTLYLNSNDFEILFNDLYEFLKDFRKKKRFDRMLFMNCFILTSESEPNYILTKQFTDFDEQLDHAFEIISKFNLIRLNADFSIFINKLEENAITEEDASNNIISKLADYFKNRTVKLNSQIFNFELNLIVKCGNCKYYTNQSHQKCGKDGIKVCGFCLKNDSPPIESVQMHYQELFIQIEKQKYYLEFGCIICKKISEHRYNHTSNLYLVCQHCYDFYKLNYCYPTEIEIQQYDIVKKRNFLYNRDGCIICSNKYGHGFPCQIDLNYCVCVRCKFYFESIGRYLTVNELKEASKKSIFGNECEVCSRYLISNCYNYNKKKICGSCYYFLIKKNYNMEKYKEFLDFLEQNSIEEDGEEDYLIELVDLKEFNNFQIKNGDQELLEKFNNQFIDLNDSFNRSYVYIYYPVKDMLNKFIYIGKGTKNRLFSHIKNLVRGNIDNQLFKKQALLNTLKTGKLGIVKYFEKSSHAKAFSIEHCLILFLLNKTTNIDSGVKKYIDNFSIREKKRLGEIFLNIIRTNFENADKYEFNYKEAFARFSLV